DDARKLRFWFFLLLSADPPYLHSFPTRRSSDLIVEQFGLATIPLGIRASASAFTSGTTSGTSGSMRQALELSTTIAPARAAIGLDRKSTRLNSSHLVISYAVFCLKKKKDIHMLS